MCYRCVLRIMHRYNTGIRAAQTRLRHIMIIVRDEYKYKKKKDNIIYRTVEKLLICTRLIRSKRRREKKSKNIVNQFDAV